MLLLCGCYVIYLFFDFVFFFFFKQKTAYEMRISDWSSDVCSSDLIFCWLDMICTLDDPAIMAESADACAKNLDQVSDPETRRKLTPEIGRASCRERVCQYV